MNWESFKEHREETLSKRWKELYKEGFRGSVIMSKLKNETGLHQQTLYRIIDVRQLKKEAPKYEHAE